MAVTDAGPAPYTSPKAVLDIVERYRSRGLPTPIDADVLARSGVVPDSLIARTLQALQTLDLIDDAGAPTETFEGLRKAPEAEYEKALGDWLRAAYADVFNFVDPASDDAIRIRDAFRSYNPVGQQGRMVTLFIGLCTAAGLMPEREMQTRSGGAASPRQRAPRPPAAESRKKSSSRRQPDAPANAIPAPLAGLLATLPSADAGWTKARRDSFLAAFEGVLDFCVPVNDAAKADDLPEDGGQEH